MKKHVLIIYFLSLIFLSSISFSAVFTGISQSKLNADLFSELAINMSNSTVTINNGDNVCSGMPIEINASFSGNYSNLNNIYVPCPTFGCGPRPSVPSSSFPFLITLVNSTQFQNNVTYYYNTQFYSSSPPPNSLAIYNYTGTYYNPPESGDQNPYKSPPASFLHNVFCYGNFSIYQDDTLFQSYSLNYSLSTSFTPTGKNIRVNSSLISCAAFVRTWETDGPTKDSVYNTSASSVQTSKSMTINIVSGPSLSFTPLSQDPAVPGQSYTMVVNVTNNGDLNATINQVNISYSGGQIPVNDFSPSSVLAGQTVQLRINVTIPSSITPGTVIYPNVSISYNSSTPVVGECGGSRSVTVSISTNGIVVGNVKPITLTARSSPSSILKEGSYYSSNKIITNITIRRDEPPNFRLDYVETNITLYYYNTTTQSFKLNASYTGISGSSGSYSSGDGNIRWSTDSDGLRIQYNQTISNYLPGVYKINISSYDPSPTDDNGQPNPVTRTRQFYFVIFNASSCVKRI